MGLGRKHKRFSTVQGATVSAAGLLLGAVAWQLASFSTAFSPYLKLVLLLFSWFAFWFFIHDLTHHIIGRVGGIRFQYYFLGRSAIRKLNLPIVSGVMERIPIFVLKVDRDSYEKASPRARRWMHASGAVASMLLPLIIIPASFAIGLFWAGPLITLLVVGNILFTLYFSPKAGDLHRARASNRKLERSRLSRRLRKLITLAVAFVLLYLFYPIWLAARSGVSVLPFGLLLMPVGTVLGTVGGFISLARVKMGGILMVIGSLVPLSFVFSGLGGGPFAISVLLWWGLPLLVGALFATGTFRRIGQKPLPFMGYGSIALPWITTYSESFLPPSFETTISVGHYFLLGFAVEGPSIMFGTGFFSLFAVIASAICLPLVVAGSSIFLLDIRKKTSNLDTSQKSRRSKSGQLLVLAGTIGGAMFLALSFLLTVGLSLTRYGLGVSGVSAGAWLAFLTGIMMRGPLSTPNLLGEESSKPPGPT